MSSATEEKVLRQRIADELRQALKSGITAPEDLIHAVENPLVRVLIIGGGGREHALAWKLEMSPRVQSIMCLPGNGGTSGGEDARIRNYGDSESDPQGVRVDDLESVVELCRSQGIGLVVVGPEQPLVNGLSDALREAGIPVFGPSAAAARIEASKAFSKDFMIRHSIPTAQHANFTSFEDARAYVLRADHDVVIKASGLAAGKGVIIPSSKDEALEALRDVMVSRRFGDSGETVVIEELMIGEEASCLAFCDG